MLVNVVVVYVLDAPNEIPPLETSNHDKVPPEGVALKFTTPFPQRVPGLTLEMVGTGFIVAITELRERLKQP